MARLNILVFYDATPHLLQINAIRDHLEAFGKHSAHHVLYTDGANRACLPTNLDRFDVLVHHYSLRLRSWHISSALQNAYRQFAGLKVLFIQDEYEATHTSWRWMTELGFHVVFTCVPAQYIEDVYPRSRFPGVTFIPTLTGYVPENLELARERIPHALRRIHFGYRGRRLPYWYGTLGREKEQIGERMRRICSERGVPYDIEIDYDKRLSGPDWLRFLSGCRAMLGTESGSNVFDFDGSIEQSIRAATEANADLSFEEIHSRYLRKHEATIRMNQISPKIFEAIAARTALVLFEGSYSGIVIPDRHYIPLRKDFGNVDAVIARVSDTEYLTDLTDRAFNEIVAPGDYSYRRFISSFERIIEQRTAPKDCRIISVAADYVYSYPVDCSTSLGSPRPQPLSIEVRNLLMDVCRLVMRGFSLGRRAVAAVWRRVRRLGQCTSDALRPSRPFACAPSPAALQAHRSIPPQRLHIASRGEQ